jgi:hypothetical protein
LMSASASGRTVVVCRGSRTIMSVGGQARLRRALPRLARRRCCRLGRSDHLYRAPAHRWSA